MDMKYKKNSWVNKLISKQVETKEIIRQNGIHYKDKSQVLDRPRYFSNLNNTSTSPVFYYQATLWGASYEGKSSVGQLA